MIKLIPALIAAVLTVAPAGAIAQPAKPDLDLQVHCSIVFSLVAREQNSGRAGADRFPMMDKLGKAFFVATGMRLLDEQKLVIDELEPFFLARVREVDSALGKGPGRAQALDSEFAKCAPLFAQVVPDAPPLVK